MSVKALAAWYYGKAKRDKRDDGKEFWKFVCDNEKDEERCRALAQHAHGDMFPDDWKYDFIVEALSNLSDTDDSRDICVEADIYTSDLTDWLGSRNDRSCYCDEAAKDGLASEKSTMMERIAAGQYLEKCEVLSLVIDYLERENQGV